MLIWRASWWDRANWKDRKTLPTVPHKNFKWKVCFPAGGSITGRSWEICLPQWINPQLDSKFHGPLKGYRSFCMWCSLPDNRSVKEKPLKGNLSQALLHLSLCFLATLRCVILSCHTLLLWCVSLRSRNNGANWLWAEPCETMSPKKLGLL